MTLSAFDAPNVRSAKVCIVTKGLAAVALAHAMAFSKMFYTDLKIGHSLQF
jgi:hypothetical protein